MKRSKQDPANSIIFLVALAMVVMSIAMSYTRGSTPALKSAGDQRNMLPLTANSSPMQNAAAKPVQLAQQPKLLAAPNAAIGDAAANSAQESSAQRPFAVSPHSRRPKRVAQLSAALPPPPLPQHRFASSLEATGSGPLPPLLPLSHNAAAGVAPRPLPPVLRLAGIIEGGEKLAIMRRGDNRYMVREGDMVEGQRVLRISANMVTLQRGARKRTLRLSR